MNAWYDDEVITVCYELLAAILQNAEAQDLPAGVTKADTILGPALDVFLHETSGMPVFNMLQIPVLGREEDAAPMSSRPTSCCGSASRKPRRMILGSAYHRAMQTSAADAAPLPATHFRTSIPCRPSARSMSCASPMARTRSCLPISLGKELLPKGRAEGCGVEYDDLTFAMTKLIGPAHRQGRGQTIS